MPVSNLTNKNIVITGASGYIGTALIQQLSGVDCTINLVSRQHSKPLQQQNSVAKILNTYADLAQQNAWETILLESKADIVFHLSAQTNLYFAEDFPQQDRIANIEPVLQLIAAVKKLNIPKLKIVLASTTSIYGNEHDNPVDEKFSNNPISVYDRHKLECEKLLLSATNAGVLRSCSLRLSNVYGYGVGSKNSNRSILNMMMGRAIMGEDLTVYGKGEYLRDFIHIDDVVEAFCMAAGENEACDGRHFIIASEQAHSLRCAFGIIADEVRSEYGRKVNVNEIPEPDNLHPIEKRNFFGNCSLFKSVTGWQATISLCEGIRRDIPKFSSGKETLK